jgi:hypothetical protein
MYVAPTQEYDHIPYAIRGLKHVSRGCLTAGLVVQYLGQPEPWRNGLISTGTLPWLDYAILLPLNTHNSLGEMHIVPEGVTMRVTLRMVILVNFRQSAAHSRNHLKATAPNPLRTCLQYPGVAPAEELMDCRQNVRPTRGIPRTGPLLLIVVNMHRFVSSPARARPASFSLLEHRRSLGVNTAWDASPRSVVLHISGGFS